MISVSVKLKIITILLNIIRKITMKLMFYHSKYRAGGQVNQFAKNKNFDLRKMGERMKAVILHDQDIIDKRNSICNDCEFKFGLNCKKCGCLIAAKTRVATTSCPVGKWDKEYNFKEGKAVNGSAPTPEL